MIPSVSSTFHLKRREDAPLAVCSPSKSSTVQFASLGCVIVFMYLPDEDSVLLVDADAYKSCNVSSHIDDFNDGNTVFSFTRSSDFYFISGNKDNCDKNEKLHVDVMANRQSNNSSLAPAPLPASPPPPPASEEPSMQPQPNKAASRVVGVMSMLVAAAGALSFAF